MGGESITPGLLCSPIALQQLVRNEQTYKFLKNVRSSPAYLQNEMHDVLAMLRSLSIPTWFLTLSAADLHWPEMIQAVCLQCDKRLSRDEVLEMSIGEQSNLLQQNPITGVCMFQHRVESFFSQYILGGSQPLGNITNYVIKI